MTLRRGDLLGVRGRRSSFRVASGSASAGSGVSFGECSPGRSRIEMRCGLRRMGLGDLGRRLSSSSSSSRKRTGLGGCRGDGATGDCDKRSSTVACCIIWGTSIEGSGKGLFLRTAEGPGVELDAVNDSNEIRSC